MTTIRELFDTSKPIDRRIEKVISYERADESLLKQEIQEYVATESIQSHLEEILDLFDEGMSGATGSEIGIWVSGFYGSGKSSFTKYLGFALDPSRTIEGKPFLEYLQNQFNSKKLRQRIATVAKKHPAAVIMLDLAEEQLAGAAMAEISTVLYAKVMQWAGYSQDRKIAYLEFMLERDGRFDEFKKRIGELSNGKTWEEIRNQPLVTRALAAKAACEFYPTFFPDTRAFNEIKIEELIKENDRVKQMLELIERKTGKSNIIIIIDEVGNYVAGRNELIVNLQGLAQNIRNIGKGRVWILATAQQTLTEDDPRAAANTEKLYKLKDRFPVPVELEASDIKEICFNRLLSKSKKGNESLSVLYNSHGPQLRYSVEIKNTRLYKAELNEETFCRYYPFLPHHFEILLRLLGRLAKTKRGGVGLRSAIKVIQDVLVEPPKDENDQTLFADNKIGELATTVRFYDTLRGDIESPFPHIINGVEKVGKVFGPDSIHARTAKSIAVLQILEDFPVSRENTAAMMHPSVDSESMLDSVDSAVNEMLNEEGIPLNEVDGKLQFMSEAVLDLENEKQKIIPRGLDIRSILNSTLREIFTPAPSVRLHGARSVSTGFKVSVGGAMPVSLSGEKESVQTYIEFVPQSEYKNRKQERLEESPHRSSASTIFLLGHEDNEIETVSTEIHRCREIYKQYRNKAGDKEVEEWLRAQDQRADGLIKELSRRIEKALSTGSFIFRGKPQAVAELDAEIAKALTGYLADVAKEVFKRYSEAPVQAESGTAERFLKTDKLNKIPSKDDPLSLVKGGTIDIDHKAVISIKNYLEQRGQVEGRRLLDDFYADPYGWSKDTTRYLTAAMLVAGIIKLRAGGEDITVRGDVAVAIIKNTSNFNKIGVSLRDNPPPLDALSRACERLLGLTGDTVLPLEEEICKAVMRTFPDFQKTYAPLAVQLEALGLSGDDRAKGIQDSISEILKGDASDAVNRLGGEECPLYDDLRWARKVIKAFNNGIGDVIRQANQFTTELPKLPDSGVPGELIESTKADLEELQNTVSHDAFYDHMPGMKKQIAALQKRITAAVEKFIVELRTKLKAEIERIQGLSEWTVLGAEDKARLGNELSGLKIEDVTGLTGLKRIISDQFSINNDLYRIEQEIRSSVIPPNVDEQETIEVNLPHGVLKFETIEALISQLEEVKNRLKDNEEIRIIWK